MPEVRRVCCFLTAWTLGFGGEHPAHAETPAPEQPSASRASEGRAAVGSSGAAGAHSVTLPSVLGASVPYPKGGKGDHEVILEIVVDSDGSVESAVAVVGSPPFSTAAESAALTWVFEPARRSGHAVKAKIRFRVKFRRPRTSAARAATDAPPAGSTSSAPSPSKSAPAPEPIEVTVTGERRGLERVLTRTEIERLPGAFGDPFRAIEALPGVVPIASGVPYFYVRGAPPGNLGYFFDGIPVPALYHFALGPGVLHPAFVERVDLYAGAYPARFGRFVGGIVAGEMAPPSYEARGEASVRVVDSGGMLEVPFAGGRGSVMLGGRYSYTGALFSLVAPEFDVGYWDYQGRIRYAIDENDSVEVFGFGSSDYYSEKVEDFEGSHNETALDLDFHRLDLRWDHELARGRYRQAVLLGLDNSWFDNGKLHFTNELLGTRSELTQTLSRRVVLRCGGDVLFERLRQRLKKPLSELGTEDVTVDEQGNVVEDPNAEPGNDSGLDFRPRRNDVVLGLRADLVLDVAPGVEIIPGLRGDLYFSGGDHAWGLDPRVTARYTLSERLTLTHGLGVAHQPPAFFIPLPGVKPSLEGGLQRSLQHSAGVEYRLPYDVSSSLVLFQNLFFNMTDAMSLDRLNDTGTGDDERFRATGRGVGAELMLRRSLSHDLGGFFAYTLSRSERSSGRLAGPAATDRTHVLQVAASYDLGRHWRLGSRLMFYSGTPALVLDLAEARHPPRAPPFWRLDWRLEKRWMLSGSSGYWGLVFEVLNATLNREVSERDCTERPCIDDSFGPLTIPSVGVEAAY